MPTPPTFAPTPDASVGLQCPYCQTALVAGEASATCGDCTACHHEDCWTENVGCAVPGCESAPDPLAAATTAAAAGVGAAGAAPGAVAGSTLPPRLSVPVDDTTRRGSRNRRTSSTGSVPIALQTPRKRRRGPIVLGVLLALMVIGAVVGLLASSGESQYTAAGGVQCSEDATQSRAQPASCVDQSVGGEPHTLDAAALRVAAQRVIRDYYGALTENTDAGRERAKLLLSNNEQTVLSQTPSELERWDGDARSIGVRLMLAEDARVVPGPPLNGLKSSQNTGIARVRVLGMQWSGDQCGGSGFEAGRFEGQTWLRHERTADGTVAWRLEPTPRDPRRIGQLTTALPLLGAECLR